MTLTNIEKAAKLLMLIRNRKNPDDEKDYLVAIGFNPYTNKADLSDVIDELGIDVDWGDFNVSAYRFSNGEEMEVGEFYTDHPTKFAAKAEAVIAVAVQIYDAKFGKDGE